ncbi:hypothetical protein L218DRAFT_951312 [Marasmius fiardii PR-910]|nr:hypothetical protein L218DRAFT_951312 [Marasmius fiardii PR-910]
MGKKAEKAGQAADVILLMAWRYYRLYGLASRSLFFRSNPLDENNIDLGELDVGEGFARPKIFVPTPSERRRQIAVIAIPVRLSPPGYINQPCSVGNWFMGSLLDLILFGNETAALTMAIQAFLFKYPQLGLLDRCLALDNDLEGFGLPMEALFLINMIVGDSIVIWRAWVLCQNSRFQKLVYLPIVMLLTSFVFTIVALDCLFLNGFGNDSSIPAGSKMCRWSEAIAWGLSLATNILSTGSIAIIAWQHRQFMKEHLRGGESRTLTRSERVLFILVESGFIYCLFWSNTQRDFITFLKVFLDAVGDQISGLYPTCIIILVNMQQSMSEFDPNLEISTLSLAPDSTLHGDLTTVRETEHRDGGSVNVMSKWKVEMNLTPLRALNT